jgi:cytochrome c biogenesis protein CcdA
MSLFDSLSTTSQIVVFLLLLTTAQPLRNSLSYLAGLSGAYFACGFGGYLVLDELRSFLGRFFPSSANIPNSLYYKSEFLTGVAMVAIGVWYFRWKKRAPQGRRENLFLMKLRNMNGGFAFSIGAFISVTSFPVSIPYLLALGKYASLGTSLSSVTWYILLYNLGYASPMLILLLVYLIIRRGTEDVHDQLHQKAEMLNVHLTAWALAGFGLFSLIDSGCYFVFGQALIKGRFF